MTSGSPVEAVRRAFALLEELNRQRINSNICTTQPLFRSRPSYACWRLFGSSATWRTIHGRADTR